MRWSVTLPSPVAVVGESVELGPDAAGRTASVSLTREEGHLRVAVTASGRKGSPGPDHEEWTARGHLAVYLNPGNDHAHRLLYVIDDGGRITAEAHLAIQGEELGDGPPQPIDEEPPRAEGAFTEDDSGGFEAVLRISEADFFTDSTIPVGLALRVGFHEDPVPDALAWPGPVSWTRETPLVFGDLFPAAPELAVTQLVATEPAWGGDPATLALTVCRSKDAPDTGRVRINVHLPGDGDEAQEPVAWSLSASDGIVTLPVRFPFRAKWANPLHRIARLELTFEDDAGRPLWVGSYPFSIDFGLIVRERFGARAGAPAPRPDPSDPCFLDRFRSYILTRLPDYVHRTTRQGAPSDFVLHDPHGDGTVDLMAEDALQQAAGVIAGRFPAWEDALCACAMWVHHPLVTRHSSSWNRIANVSSVDTVMRLGGCFCGDTARLTAALAEAVGDCLNVALTGYAMGLRGHLGTLVDSPGGRVVIDGMLGLWFHTLDNTRLATLGEMRQTDAIARRVWYAPDANGHEFFYGYDTQIIRPWKSGPLVWPGGSE